MSLEFRDNERFLPVVHGDDCLCDDCIDAYLDNATFDSCPGIVPPSASMFDDVANVPADERSIAMSIPRHEDC